MFGEQAARAHIKVDGKNTGRTRYVNSLLTHGVPCRMVTQTGIGSSVHVGLHPSAQPTRLDYLIPIPSRLEFCLRRTTGPWPALRA